MAAPVATRVPGASGAPSQQMYFPFMASLSRNVGKYEKVMSETMVRFVTQFVGDTTRKLAQRA